MTMLTALSVIRSRLTAVAVALGIAIGVLALILAGISMGQDTRVALDLALAGTTLGSIALTIIVTANLVLAEQDRGTMLILRPKPITARAIVLGKYFGLLLALTLLYLITGGLAFAILSAKLAFPHTEVLLTLLIGWGELALVCALAVFFATWTGSLLATVLTIGFYLGGTSLVLIKQAATQTGGFVSWLGNILFQILPNFSKYNLHETYLTATQLPGSYYLNVGIYTLAYVAILLILSTVIFARREW